MKVTLINPEEVKELFSTWGTFSSVCYNTETSTPETIGKSCMKSGHFSGSRWRFICFKIENCPRFIIDQLVRHEKGVIKNVQSFRYVNKNNFDYSIPEEIKDNDDLMARYYYHMRETLKLYTEIQSYVKYHTKNNEKANEQARYVLPMATHTSCTVALNVEAIIHYCNTRLCSRAEDKHRELAKLIKEEIIKVLPDLADYLVPQCQYLLWCPEQKSCGAYPTKKELKDKLKEKKNEH